MMKRIVSVVIMTLLLVACGNSKAYNIKGEMGDSTWDGKKVSLLSISKASSMSPIDSAIIKDGAFELKGKVDSAGWYVLAIDNELGQPIYKDFFVEGNLKFTLKTGKMHITGGPVNDAYQTFSDKYDGLSAGVIRLNAELKADPGNHELEKAFNDEYEHFSREFRKLAVSTIMENLDNPLALHLFQVTLASLENGDIESILSKASPEFLADPSVKMVSQQLALSKKVSVGQHYADLAMFDTDSKPITLSEYVGKGSYVLIDFWASWCAPCMKELPNVMACYEKYHKKGFEVVGVSLDKDAGAWKAAISKNRIPWPQMSDLAGWESQAVSVYSFSGIPHTVLVDPKGVIIAKDLRGADLAEKLSELFDK